MNTTTVGSQSFQAIEPMWDGGFVVTWGSAHGGTGDVYAQRYHASGRTVGGEFLVNPTTNGSQGSSKVAYLPDGNFVVAWMSSGSTADGIYLRVVSDTIAPNSPAITAFADNTGSTADHLTGDTTPTLTITAEAGSSVSIYRDGTLVGTATESSPGTFSFTSAVLADGRYLFNATARDEEGNTSAVSGTYGVQVDATAPLTSIAGVAEDGGGYRVAYDTTPTLAIAGEAGSTVSVFRDGALVGTATEGAAGTFAFTSARLANGNYQFTASATDAAGNSGSASGPIAVQIDTGPPTFDSDGTLVNDDYYRARYPDVAASGMDPDQHYAEFGWREGRDPNAFFSTSGYLAANPDIAGSNPLAHYQAAGWREGREPSANFDTELYLLHNPDVRASGMKLLLHYLQFGHAEGRETFMSVGKPSDIIHGSFDVEYYLLANPDVARFVQGDANVAEAAYRHYQTSGWREGRDPNAYFDTDGYLNFNVDVRAAGMEPLLHYDISGWREGRDPSGSFDTSSYLAANPDVRAAGMDPLTHFLIFGVHEGRLPQGDSLFG